MIFRIVKIIETRMRMNNYIMKYKILIGMVSYVQIGFRMGFMII